MLEHFDFELNRIKELRMLLKMFDLEDIWLLGFTPYTDIITGRCVFLAAPLVEGGGIMAFETFEGLSEFVRGILAEKHLQTAMEEL
jgi:hypothetical protein